MTSALRRASVVLAGGVAAVGLFAPTAAAADTPVVLACQATPPIGSAQTFNLNAGVNAAAPATVAAGSQFTVTLAPDALTVPTTVGGYSIQSISNIVLTVPVPANATLTGESLTGGSGYSGSASVAVNNGNVVLTVNGSVDGGGTFTLPALTLNLAAGASGSVISTSVAGTSYANPGLTFTATVPVSFFTVDVPTACYPATAQALSTTTVS
ncbi:cyclase [Kitasatospora sp. NPDC058478]|uniref:cyclase n=1 Tax=unclassified Kitasatospora TaxID=2633591 RepID=UPI00364644B9